MFSFIHRSSAKPVVFALAAMSISLMSGGCSDKAKEDTAAIRATLEKQEAEQAEKEKASQAITRSIGDAANQPRKIIKY